LADSGALHLALRFGLRTTPGTYQIPLLATLVLGGLPMLYVLMRKLVKRELGSIWVGFRLVIATPCPLLLAIPIAIIGSIFRYARRAIIVKTPVVLEQIAGCRTAIFAKTGTLTSGEPKLTEQLIAPGFDPSFGTFTLHKSCLPCRFKTYRQADTSRKREHGGLK
jgi:hypothetical protein